MFLVSCDTGYRKKNGDWVWITNDVNFGERSHWIEGIDQESFVVLGNENFALDNNQVYFKGKRIKNATPKDFVCLTDDGYGYAKNNDYVFFDNEVILKADPKSFKIIEYPYSKDNHDVYCGTMPLGLSTDEVQTFKVTTADKSLRGTKNIMALNYFLEFNPTYQWITTLNIEIGNVIIGGSGTGETHKRKFIGINEVDGK